MFPLHTWLPPAHTIAPTGGSVLLAGVLLKLGTYGMVRVAVPIVPEGVRALAPFLGALGVAGILWGGLACFVERDLKRLVAFSSVAHMGFVLLGIASLTAVGLQGALFANVAHGLVTGLLFLVVGALKDRHHSADLAVDRPRPARPAAPAGVAAGLRRARRTGPAGARGLLGRAARDRRSVELDRPGAAGSPAGRARRHRDRGRGRLSAAGAPARLARSAALAPGRDRSDGAPVRGTSPARIPPPVTMGDATAHEVSVTGPLVVAVAVLGVLPWLLLDVTGPAVRALLGVLPGGAP